MLDSLKSHVAPGGSPEQANWLKTPEYPATLSSVRKRAIESPGATLADCVPVVDTPISAMTPGCKFGFGLAK
jgi:hypothetical protein